MAQKGGKDGLYKIIMIGDGGVGKTTLVKRHLTGHFQDKYVATLGLEAHNLEFLTTAGPITFNVWDTAGQERRGKLTEFYFVGAQGAIILFDLTSKITCKNVMEWHQYVLKVCPNIPVVVCGNKCDINEIKVKTKHMKYTLERNLKFHFISAKSNYQIDMPFLYLAKELLGDQSLSFKRFPAVLPPEIQLSSWKRAVLKKEQEKVDAAARGQAMDDEDL